MLKNAIFQYHAGKDEEDQIACSKYDFQQLEW